MSKDNPSKKRRIRKGRNAKNSCIHCKKAHKACSTEKPCTRCKKKGLKCTIEGMGTPQSNSMYAMPMVSGNAAFLGFGNNMQGQQSYPNPHGTPGNPSMYYSAGYPQGGPQQSGHQNMTPHMEYHPTPSPSAPSGTIMRQSPNPHQTQMMGGHTHAQSHFSSHPQSHPQTHAQLHPQSRPHSHPHAHPPSHPHSQGPSHPHSQAPSHPHSQTTQQGMGMQQMVSQSPQMMTQQMSPAIMMQQPPTHGHYMTPGSNIGMKIRNSSPMQGSHMPMNGYSHRVSNQMPQHPDIPYLKRLIAEQNVQLSNLENKVKQLVDYVTKPNPFSEGFSTQDTPSCILTVDVENKCCRILAGNNAFISMACDASPYFADQLDKYGCLPPNELTDYDAGITQYNFDPHDQDLLEYEQAVQRDSIVELMKMNLPGVQWEKKVRVGSEIYIQRFQFDYNLLYSSFDGPHDTYDDGMVILGHTFEPEFVKPVDAYMTKEEANKCFSRLWVSFRSVLPEYYKLLATFGASNHAPLQGIRRSQSGSVNLMSGQRDVHMKDDQYE